MSRSQNLSRISISGWIVFSIAAFSAHTLCAQANGLYDEIGRSKEVVRDLFPELRGRGLPLRIDDETTLDGTAHPLSFTLNVIEPDAGVGAGKKCPAPLLISVEFQFTLHAPDERLFALNAGGPTVNSEKRDQLNRLVDSHPEWSDQDVAGAVSRAGARYGPSNKDEFSRTIPISPLKLLLGDVQVDSVFFTIRDKQQMNERLPSSILLWTVVMRSHLPEGNANYYALFEPFQGKLVSLAKVPPIP